MVILFSIFLLWLSWKKPTISLAIILHINIIRSAITIDINNICLRCLEDSNIYLGAVLPILSFSIIISRIFYKKKTIKYKVDDFDFFIIGLIVVSFIGVFISENILNSLLFWLRLLLLGVSFFIVSKLHFSNVYNIEKEITYFSRTTLILSFLLGLSSIFFVLYSNENIWRMSMPGTHPIPYALLMGLASIIYFFSFFDSRIIGKTNYLWHIMGVIAIILLFLSQTKGVIVSLFISVIFFIIGLRLKISKKWFKISLIILLVIIIILSFNYDFSDVFQRLLNFGSSKDQSTQERLRIYMDSFSLIFKNPVLGVGTDGFQYHSFGSYPHNIILEFLTNYGIAGLILALYLMVIILFISLKTWSRSNKNLLLKIIASIFVFFFTETMFSFTLWMHKGLYFSMALYSVYYHYDKKERSHIVKD